MKKITVFISVIFVLFKNKIIGNDEVITCRPEDLLEPEFEKWNINSLRNH